MPDGDGSILDNFQLRLAGCEVARTDRTATSLVGADGESHLPFRVPMRSAGW